jgi:hypothetical protein
MQRLILIPLGILALVAATSCEEATRPLLPHPLSGTYDVTAELEHFHHEGGSGCHPERMYCVITVPAGDASLRGTLIIGQNVERWAETVYFWDVRGTFDGRFCGRVDGDCGTLTPTTINFVSGEATVPSRPASELRFTGHIHGAGVDAPRIEFTAIEVAGNEIRGTLRWTMTRLVRQPPAYSGRFTARRRD